MYTNKWEQFGPRYGYSDKKEKKRNWSVILIDIAIILMIILETFLIFTLLTYGINISAICALINVLITIGNLYLLRKLQKRSW